MIFLKSSNVADSEQVKAIIISKEITDIVFQNVQITVNQFLESTIDLMTHSCLNPETQITKASERFSQKLGSENELFNFKGELAARHYCVFISLGADISFNFPLQKAHIQVNSGDVIVLPSSYLYPFVAEIKNDGDLMEILYIFNKGSVVDTEETLSKNRAY